MTPDRFDVEGEWIECNPGFLDQPGGAAIWGDYIDRIMEAADERGAWGLLGRRPNMDLLLFDLQEGWRLGLRAKNCRSVKLVAPPRGWDS